MLGNSDANITFLSLVNLLELVGFDLRIKGSHHIFTKQGIEEIINIQEKKGKAKPYQVKQVREIFLKYNLNNITDELT